MPSSSQHSFPNIFRKISGIETGTSAGTNIAFTSSTPMPMPIQPSGNGNGNGSASLNMSQNIHKGGMVRPL
jgi:hypothetical protein